jgi:hypothetical protein
MSIISARTGRAIGAVAAALLIAMAMLTATNVTVKAAEASVVTPQACEMWALTDRVDGQGRMYGAGGIYNCGRVASLGATLYRNGAIVASRTIYDCNSPCGVSTPSVAIPSGPQTWCTIVRANTIAGFRETSHCAVTG